MNGAHDLGGKDGFGPVQPEPELQEPVFHADWEGRVYGIARVVGRLRLWNGDMSRFARERQHPADYLRHSYYENWLAGMEKQLVESGLVTPSELQTGKAEFAAPDAIAQRLMRPEDAREAPLMTTNYLRPAAAPPRFTAGDRVRAINRHPRGHTREPQYIRGHVGVVHDYYGAQVFPDLSAQGITEGRHLYSVRFEARELWGESANARSAVYVDMWEDYLEPEA